jgi:cephalosporin hydroxylase
MKLVLDTEARTLIEEHDGRTRTLDLYTPEAFEVLSLQWLRVGWAEKYPHTFTWLGRPIIQLPEDMVRAQEVIYRIKPDVIIETGVAHGGSLVFYASLCKILGKGRVIGVDIEIRPHNRQGIESHELASYVTLVHGGSTTPQIVKRVHDLVKAGERTFVVLDSDHTREHVREELEAYHDLVAPGSYIVAADGIMKDLHDVPRGKPEWARNHPMAAAADFAAIHPEFVLEQPPWLFSESKLKMNVTYWPGAWLRRTDGR